MALSVNLLGAISIATLGKHLLHPVTGERPVRAPFLEVRLVAYQATDVAANDDAGAQGDVFAKGEPPGRGEVAITSIPELYEYIMSASRSSHSSLRFIGDKGRRSTHTHDLDQIRRLALEHQQILISVPILKEEKVQLKRGKRLLARRQADCLLGSVIAIRRGRRVDAMIHPPWDAELALRRREQHLAALELDRHLTLQHGEVLLLEGVEVRRGLLVAEGAQTRVVEVEGHFDGKGPGRMGDDTGCDAALEAGEVSMKSLFVWWTFASTSR